MFESEIDTVNGLLTSVEFLGGFVAGLGILVTFAISPTARSNRTFGYAGWTAVILTVAMYLDFGRRLGAFAGLAVLGTAGWWLENRPGLGGRAASWIAIAAGAIVFAWRSGLDAPVWAVAAIPLFVVGVGASLLRWRAVGLGGLIGPVIALGTIGIWATIPDTEMARVLLGCTLPLFAVTPHPLEGRITASGALMMAAMVAWIVVQGGADRPASIVGAFGCFTVVIVVAALVGSSSLSIRGGAATLMGIHAAAVFVSSRFIGLGAPAAPAAGSLLLLAVVVTAVLKMATKSGTALTADS